MRIGNIIVDKKLFMTMLIVFVMITGLVGYSYLNSDLSSLSSLVINKYNCNQENLYDRLACMSTPDNTKSQYVSSNMGVDFSKISSDTNGKGIYTLSSTIGDTYPVHYYRGNVTDNNVKFANFCWKIVRTTDTGGTKLVYNGVPDVNGNCTGRTADNTTIGNTPYAHATSPAYIGYMYGEVYKRSSIVEGSFNYSSTFSYSEANNLYTLSSPTTDSSLAPTNHYSCLGEGTSCTKLKYIYYKNDSNLYYIELENGKSVEDALNEMLFNSNNSTNSRLKSFIDNWYANNMQDYSYYLEDTIWCNNRTINNLGTWDPTGGLLVSTYTYFKNYDDLIAGKVNLSCPKNDSFTKSNKSGNQKLIYKAATLTLQELQLAGGYDNLANDNMYLNNGTIWYSMSPSFIGYDNTLAYELRGNGSINQHGYGFNNRAVRPAVSLKHDMMIVSGTGTEDSPYVISAPSNYQTYTLTNKVKNGSFEDGLNNWEKGLYVDENTEYHSVSTAFNYFGSSSVKRIASTETSKNYIKQAIDFTVNHKYYYFLYGYTNSTTNNNIVSDVSNRTPSTIFLTINKSNGWTKDSVIYTSAATETAFVAVNYSITNAETYADGVGVVDLTEAFGAGNEPDLEWCNANIDYFDGTMVIAKEN